MKSQYLYVHLIIGCILCMGMTLYLLLSSYHPLNPPAFIHITISKTGYQPALIQAHAGQPIQLEFSKIQDAPCSGAVVFPQLKVFYSLVYSTSTKIILPPLGPGRLDFVCPQGRYRGKILVS